MDNSNNIDMTYFFYNCISLTYLPNYKKYEENDKKYNIFENCINLVKI